MAVLLPLIFVIESRADGDHGRQPSLESDRQVLTTATDGSNRVVLGDGTVLHSTQRHVTNLRRIDITGSPVSIVIWDETDANGASVAGYALSLDGHSFTPARYADYAVHLRSGTFDPRRETDAVMTALSAGSDCRLFIVQFITQPVNVYRARIQDVGGRIRAFLPNDSYVIEFPEGVEEVVAGWPFVRWVGPFHPEYRLEPALRERLSRAAASDLTQRYRIRVGERGMRLKSRVAARIRDLGGTVERITPGGYLLEATLSDSVLRLVVRWNDVLFVDRWEPADSDSDLARAISGANFLESVAGYTGEGVRGEVMDTNVDPTHPDLSSRPLLFHGPRSESAEHGTASVGINFGDGTLLADARGILPSGQGIFADFEELTDRYAHTAELLQAPFFAVYQTNSWGNGGTPDYDNVSAEFDDILFQNDILVCQSQSNNGDRRSRSQAWAKNVVSVGGLKHHDTLARDDDEWDGGASTGPASDGRIKPDLSHFFDPVLTLDVEGEYQEFCCTSAATAITGGYFGLFFEMWHDGVFGNGTRGSVFHSRPHMSTAKAMMINTAYRYPFEGVDHDLTRTHQGWGMVDLETMYDLRNRMFVVDESHILTVLTSKRYELTVPDGEPVFRATLVYSDPAGAPFATIHRVNDLSLRVTDPSGVVYHGNWGLDVGNESIPGGEANALDTVENVFVSHPMPGQWAVEVTADEINEDGHVETEALDADFALVVSGVVREGAAPHDGYYDYDYDGDTDLFDFDMTIGCLSGPVESEEFPGIDPGCGPADCDLDGDVDLVDVSCFVRSYSGDCGVRIESGPDDQSHCEGDVVSLHVDLAGKDAQVQWLRNGIAIDGETDTTLVIDSADHDLDSGQYAVVVWSDCTMTQSRTAEVSVAHPPFAFMWPTERAVCTGSLVSIDAFVTGTPPVTVQWHLNGKIIPDATHVPLVLSSVGDTDFGSYSLEVHDGCDLVGMSNAFELRKKDVVFVEQPVGGTYCVGDMIELSASANGGPVYQWYRDGQFISGGGSRVLRINAATLNDAGTYYVSATNECNMGQSNDAVIVVNECGDRG